MPLTRHPEHPIVTPGGLPWRRVSTFNPGVILHDGRFWMLEPPQALLDHVLRFPR